MDVSLLEANKLARQSQSFLENIDPIKIHRVGAAGALKLVCIANTWSQVSQGRQWHHSVCGSRCRHFVGQVCHSILTSLRPPKCCVWKSTKRNGPKLTVCYTLWSLDFCIFPRNIRLREVALQHGDAVLMLTSPTPLRPIYCEHYCNYITVSIYITINYTRYTKNIVTNWYGLYPAITSLIGVREKKDTKPKSKTNV